MSAVSNASAPAPMGTVSEVDPATVHQWLNAGQCVLIDVREPDEHAREHISGGALHPLSRFDTSRIEVAPGTRIVFHCRSGKRSADAANRTLAGRASTVGIYTMAGGIEAWKAQDLPVVVNANVSRISIMRQVQLVVGTGVLVGSVLAWFVHPAFLIVPAFFGAGLVFAGASGTCALATALSWMPWNKFAASKDKSEAGCAGGTCKM